MAYVITNKSVREDELIFLDKENGMKMAIYQLPEKVKDITPDDDEVVFVVEAGNQREALYSLHTRTSILDIKCGIEIDEPRYSLDNFKGITLTKPYNKEWYERQP